MPNGNLRTRLLAAFALAWAGLAALLVALGSACGGDDGVRVSVLELVPSERVTTADFPITLAFAPDGRLFYNEFATGNTRIITPDGQLLPEPFSHVDAVAPGYPPSEWGLIGLAVDPDFESNHYVYIYYMELVSEIEPHPETEISVITRPVVLRFTEVDNRGVDPTVIVDDLPEIEPDRKPFHVAGNIHFGPDGYLYVSIGNMERPEAALDLSTPKGKILRVNKEDGSAPADNPFVDEPGADPRVFAYGFRNPFDFTFNHQTGGLYAGDNGADICDELNLVVAGQNYGSSPLEYEHLIEQGRCDAAPEGVQAIYYFAREGTRPEEPFSNPAPTGIEFLPADEYPALGDSLLVCDFQHSFMRVLALEGPDFDVVNEGPVIAEDCRLDVARAPDGAIYYSNFEEIRRLLIE